MEKGFSNEVCAVSFGTAGASLRQLLYSMDKTSFFLRTGSRLRRIVYTFLLLASSISLASATVYAQSTDVSRSTGQPRQNFAAKSTARTALPQLKRLMGLRSGLVSEGSRISLSSDQPLNDYSAYRSGERFFIVIPHATAETLQTNVSGPGFTDARVEQRGDETLVSFRLESGATANVTQKFNRLDITFIVPGEAQSSVAVA